MRFIILTVLFTILLNSEGLIRHARDCGCVHQIPDEPYVRVLCPEFDNMANLTIAEFTNLFIGRRTTLYLRATMSSLMISDDNGGRHILFDNLNWNFFLANVNLRSLHLVQHNAPVDNSRALSTMNVIRIYGPIGIQLRFTNVLIEFCTNDFLSVRIRGQLNGMNFHGSSRGAYFHLEFDGTSIRIAINTGVRELDTMSRTYYALNVLLGISNSTSFHHGKSIKDIRT